MAKWLEEIGLGMFVANLSDSGVHGALVALDETFDIPAFSHILQLPDSDQNFHDILQSQFEKLVAEYRIAGRSDRDVKKELHKIKENIGRRE